MGVEPTYSLRSHRNQTGPHTNDANVTQAFKFLQNFFRLPDLFCTGGCLQDWALYHCGTKYIGGGGIFKLALRVSNTVCMRRYLPLL